jgi:hypothetical protein
MSACRGMCTTVHNSGICVCFDVRNGFHRPENRRFPDDDTNVISDTD